MKKEKFKKKRKEKDQLTKWRRKRGTSATPKKGTNSTTLYIRLYTFSDPHLRLGQLNHRKYLFVLRVPTLLSLMLSLLLPRQGNDPPIASIPTLKSRFSPQICIQNCSFSLLSNLQENPRSGICNPWIRGFDSRQSIAFEALSVDLTTLSLDLFCKVSFFFSSINCVKPFFRLLVFMCVVWLAACSRLYSF